MQKHEPDQSQALFDAIITGMKEWRAAHPKATMREIELEGRRTGEPLGSAFDL